MTSDMPAMDEKILPCPMCGFTGHLRFEFRWQQKHFFIECQDVDCLTKGPERLTESEATSAWNRRASLQTAPEVEVVAWRRHGKYRWFYRESPPPKGEAGWFPLTDCLAIPQPAPDTEVKP